MCGVIGIIGSSEQDRDDFWSAHEVYRGLLTLQHRGQDAAGILSFNEHKQKFKIEKDLGLVASVFDEQKIKRLRGNMSIGHTRYATSGGDSKTDLQPLVTGFPFGAGMVHNGNILNYHQLAEASNEENFQQLITNNDLELLLNMWCQVIWDETTKGEKPTFNEIKKAASEIFEKVNGAYAVVGMMSHMGLIAFRDPKGIRPLVLGKKVCSSSGKVDYCLTSETIALNFLGYELVRDIEPGEVILITNEGEIFSEVLINESEQKNKRSCMFEFVYFAGAESRVEGRSVYAARLDLGKVLAKKARDLIGSGEISPDIVCPVPDTSRTASISLAEELRLPYREGLIKNRYIQRSFILKTQEAREKAVELKLSPVMSEIKGKNILLVDDSVVRGTTSKQIIKLLKRYGAKEITLAITCPPLRYACYYGIDFPRPKELIATDKTVDEIASWMGANKVIYLDEADMKTAIGTKNLCMACVSGEYPTSIVEAEEFAKRRNDLRE